MAVKMIVFTAILAGLFVSVYGLQCYQGTCGDLTSACLTDQNITQCVEGTEMCQSLDACRLSWTPFGSLYVCYRVHGCAAIGQTIPAGSHSNGCKFVDGAGLGGSLSMVQCYCRGELCNART
ncbi:hypothetical protein BV898_04565 [Hypsibius exemplaris]|uniref:UPAR/Ly6 domain-containing protein n=1 Tax=Hypsibius exemplaris TaxID=2072580 RepID=A0A1W0X1M3_HYPEX|nr:hypothetical protein BV898_04565 [Hypsibius exemplaris]